jgi:hypothetical protein
LSSSVRNETGSDRARFSRFERTRQAVSAKLPIVEETDKDAVGFYSANDFVITSLGEKYPGIERFRLHLDALADTGEHPST